MEVLKTRRDINIAKKQPDPLQYTFTGDSEYKRTRHGWLLMLKSSGTLTVQNDANVDVFLVGGGGGGSRATAGSYGTIDAGGGSGNTQTVFSVALKTTKEYNATIGSGSSGWGVDSSLSENGGSTIGTANGGHSAYVSAYYNSYAGSGGSGGSVIVVNETETMFLQGGLDGGDGEVAPQGSTACAVGTGQGTTTRAFGEANGDLYASGGDAFATTPSEDPGIPNSGNGGCSGYPGCSGVILIRNH